MVVLPAAYGNVTGVSMFVLEELVINSFNATTNIDVSQLGTCDFLGEISLKGKCAC